MRDLVGRILICFGLIVLALYPIMSAVTGHWGHVGVCLMVYAYTISVLLYVYRHVLPELWRNICQSFQFG